MHLRGKFFAMATVAAVALAGLAGPRPADAAEHEWKMHIVWVPSRPEAQAYQHFVDEVNEKAGEELHIQLYSSGSLGVKDADMLRILPRGNIIQAAGLYPGYLTRDKPDYAYTLPPGVAASPETLERILPDLRQIYEETYEPVGIKLLGFVGHAVRDTHIMCKEPINTLEQLRGKKLRVWEQFHVDAFEKLGISAQIIGQNDLYVAMQTGVVDCAVYPISYGARPGAAADGSPAVSNDLPNVTIADLRHAAMHEHPGTLSDLLFRRVKVGWTATMGHEAALPAARAVAKILDWDEARISREVSEYRDRLRHLHLLDTHPASGDIPR